MRGIVVLILFFSTVEAIPIDNHVIGEPEITCGSDSIAVSFEVQNEFKGNVFVKGLFDQPECRIAGDGDKGARLILPFEGCNTQRTRSLNPKGIFVSTVVMISFHPQFVTKVDNAYRVRCFYMEAAKTVNTNVDISDITTLFYSVNIPMPVCRYDILDGGPNGQPVHFATVGQQVYHKWTCDTETVDTFCAIVHSCYADDGNDNRIEILNADGCALDKYLLNNLEYPTDLMAGQESHVYKYADRSQIYYQCQISITVKEPNEQCPRPICEEPKGFGSTAAKTTNSNAILPVTSASFSTQSSFERDAHGSQPSPHTERPKTSRPSSHPDIPQIRHPSSNLDRPETRRPLGHTDRSKTTHPSGNVNRSETIRPLSHIDRSETRRPSGNVNRSETIRPLSHIGRSETRRPSGRINRPEIRRPFSHIDKPKTRRPLIHLDRPGTRRPFNSLNGPRTRRPLYRQQTSTFASELDSSFNHQPGFTPAPQFETSRPSITLTESETFIGGYGRLRRSVDQNIIDVSVDLETLDVLQSGVVLPADLQRRNLQYFVEVKRGICVTALQMSFLFIGFASLMIFFVAAVYILKR